MTTEIVHHVELTDPQLCFVITALHTQFQGENAAVAIAMSNMLHDVRDKNLKARDALKVRKSQRNDRDGADVRK